MNYKKLFLSCCLSVCVNASYLVLKDPENKEKINEFGEAIESFSTTSVSTDLVISADVMPPAEDTFILNETR